MQCMLAAMGSVGAASGLRGWLGRRLEGRVSPTFMRRLTLSLCATAILASGILLSGSG